MQDASGNTTQFKIKTATALKKLMSTYCERNGLDVQVYTKRCLFTKLLSKRVFGFTLYNLTSTHQSIRFTFDGQRVTGADTAASLGLEEGDTIEVFQVNTFT